MYLPRSKITIGSKYFGGVHDIKIKRSIHTIGATASVKVPVTAVLRQTGTPPAYVETAQVIKAGDPVEIQLGYDGRLYTEFRGYVKLLNLCLFMFFLLLFNGLNNRGCGTDDASNSSNVSTVFGDF